MATVLPLKPYLKLSTNCLLTRKTSHSKSSEILLYKKNKGRKRMNLRAIGGISSPSPNINRIRVDASAGGNPPGAQFAPLAAVFRRRLLTGLSTASLVAFGANFGGITSSILSFTPEFARELKLDVLYPIQGFTRCIDLDNGFEFIYPASWVGDQTLLYRAAGNSESQRSLDPPPLNGRLKPRSSLNEPSVAFGPPGSNGELNVSVIVSKVPPDFSIEAFGGPRDIGESVLKKIAVSRKGTEITATLIDASLREKDGIKYYKLEFKVQSPTFSRHNVAVCCAQDGKLYTLNAQAAESNWPRVRQQFCTMADSFILTDT